MSKTVLIVFAHPSKSSLTRAYRDATVAKLEGLGHRVLQSDLYAMAWKAQVDATDFPATIETDMFDVVAASKQATAAGTLTADVSTEQSKLLQADLVILQFPLWWFGLPAIMKGWVDRVFSYGFGYGYRLQGNNFRYGDGILTGRRAVLNVIAGGPLLDYGPRGINGDLDELLFPITHGMLFYAGLTVLRTHAVYSSLQRSRQELRAELACWEQRLDTIFTETAIPFRKQNDGDYPDRHVLSDEIAPGAGGLAVHLATSPGVPAATGISE